MKKNRKPQVLNDWQVFLHFQSVVKLLLTCLYCHGFFEQDQAACIGEDAKRFFSRIIENGKKTMITKFILQQHEKPLIWFRPRLTVKRERRMIFGIIGLPQ